jgi:hypothetical protein
MCRLAAITAAEYFSPLENIYALETMKEGHDGSGMGLVLKDLGGWAEPLKGYPVLSGICTHEGYKKVEEYMSAGGFSLVHSWSPKVKPMAPGADIRTRDRYFSNFYDYPPEYKDKPWAEKEALLLRTRLALRGMVKPPSNGVIDESIVVFSFYPDVITLKEVGDPLTLADYFGLDRGEVLKARIILAQGRQNTNYGINLYACHPFFIQGYGSMTNGENTAFVPIREYLMSRGFPGYIGYQSDSEVFTHILHYTHKVLGYPLHYYKDVITPLKRAEMELRPDKEALFLMRQSLRMLVIDGPNCVIGFTPNGTCFMVQDTKKLRPGAVGGVRGKYALMSEECGVDKAVPKRDKSKDIFPMKYDMVMIPPGAEGARIWNQQAGY